MFMQPYTFWWILAGLAIVTELLTGTIYLLLMALGLVAGALAAHAGLGWPTQILVASVVGILSVLIGRRFRQAGPPRLPANSAPDLHLDIGEILHVPEWNPDGTARIPYRGSQWTVALRPGTMMAPGLHRVVEVQGNRLIVDKA